MAKRTWKVYGADGHRQRESFNESYTWDFSNEKEGVRILTVQNADVTGTHEYSIITIERNTPKECLEELEGQISDGIFENSKVGKVVEVKTTYRVDYHDNIGPNDYSEYFDTEAEAVEWICNEQQQNYDVLCEMLDKLWDYFEKSLEITEKQGENKHGIWIVGPELLCKTEGQANGIADFLEDLGFEDVTTGYYDPEEDERNGEVDECTGYWYVNVE